VKLNVESGEETIEGTEFQTGFLWTPAEAKLLAALGVAGAQEWIKNEVSPGSLQAARSVGNMRNRAARSATLLPFRNNRLNSRSTAPFRSEWVLYRTRAVSLWANAMKLGK
jgi:hypothetical protein